jgi:hypothetical protein
MLKGLLRLGVAAVALAAPATAFAATPTELFFSEYIEGSSNNKALEIYNGTPFTVNLGLQGYSVQMFFNGSSSALTTVNLAGSVAPGDVYVLAQSSAAAAILNQADQTSSASWYNGDDAVVLRKGTQIVDVIGQIGFDPGTEWGTGLTSTADNTLRRKDAITAGDTNGADVFDPALEWSGFATDTFGGLGTHGDAAPSIVSTSPVDGATDVPVDSNLSVTFSEPVTLAPDAFLIVCSASGTHDWTVTGGPTTFTIDPTTNFVANETCAVNIAAEGVADNDVQDPPDTMAAPFAFHVSTPAPVAITPIHEVQGADLTSPKAGQALTVEGVVVGDYQLSSQFSGFFLQEEDADADTDPATSEGIFVFGGGVAVAPGDVVRVRGRVSEFNGLTELTPVSGGVSLRGSGASVTPAVVSLPVASVNDLERYEGMNVAFPQTLTVTEVFTLARFGEVRLSSGGRLYTPTAVAAPGADATAVAEQNARRTILLDDTNGQQNIDPTLYPQGGLSATNTLRVGDSVPGLTGVLDFRFDAYRVQPVGPIAFDHTNPRESAPEPVGGNLRVASFNVLNYFNGDGLGGGFPTSRGADSPTEFARQRAKEISALKAMNADVVGLMEMENDAGPNSAVADLVSGLNDAMGAGTYAYVDTGVIGTDEIKVALIYKPGSVTPVGDWKIITSAVDARFDTTRNRPSLAQTFSQYATGRQLTVVVNHLKSKGSACDGDPDTGDGSGNCNETRTRAAAALVDWLKTDPTGSGDPDYLLIGDMNSYTFESPIQTFVDGGLTNLVRKYGGLTAYSYVFDGQTGYLDHALATKSLESHVVGVGHWHVNADEPVALDYNVEFKSAGQQASFYSPEPFRASDHDPVVIGIQLTVTAQSLCALTERYVTKAGVANSLCAKLEHGSWNAFANEVAAQSGKSLTDEQAATLTRLVGRLA